MGGVDRHDKILKYYSLSRKSMKWYKKYSFHIFEICVFNASCLYRKQDANKNVRELKFREMLIDEILNYTGPHPAANTRAKPTRIRRSAEPFPRLTERHFLSFLPKTAVEAAKNIKNFRVYSMCPTTATAGMKQKRTVTPYWCEECGLAFCVDPCFKKFHTQLYA